MMVEKKCCLCVLLKINKKNVGVSVFYLYLKLRLNNYGDICFSLNL